MIKNYYANYMMRQYVVSEVGDVKLKTKKNGKKIYRPYYRSFWPRLHGVEYGKNMLNVTGCFQRERNRRRI